MFFGAFSFFLLWIISVAGGIAVSLSWVYVEPEYDEEGILTRSSYCSVRARALLTVGCMVFWICNSIGYALAGPHQGPIEFWQHHPVLLQILFFPANPLLIASVVFAWQARGSGRWILWIATPIIAVAAITASIVLYLP
jgi:hypothetical protein